MKRNQHSSRRTTLCLEPLEDRSLLSAGAMDTTFGSGGIVTTAVGYNDAAMALAIYPNAGTANDGKIVAAGEASTKNGNPDFAVVRYNPNGTPDTSFNGSGKVTTAFGNKTLESAADVAIQPDGKVVAAGWTFINNSYDFALVRYNLNGSLDISFDADGKVSTNFAGSNRSVSHDQAKSTAIQTDGKIVLAGWSNDDIGLARYNANGSLDTSFDGDGKVLTPFSAVSGSSGTVVHDMALSPVDGKIVVVGATRLAGTLRYDVLVVRYNTNGSLDTTLGGTGIVTLPMINNDGQESGKTVAIQADGKIVLAWTTKPAPAPNDIALVRYNTDGSLDSTFGSNGIAVTNLPTTDESVGAVAIQPDGKIVVAGSQSGPWLAARYQTNGTLDVTFGTNGIATTPTPISNPARAVAIQADGKIVLAGLVNATQHFALVRFTGDAPSPLMAAALPASVAPNAAPITLTSAQSLLVQALARWQSAGVDVSSLHGIDVRIGNLPGATLGQASGNTVWLDDNAAGWGWFVDPTPGDDSEFTTPGDQGEQNRMDLLTVLEHELGHLLGFDHEQAGVMEDTLAAGTRQSSSAGTVSDWSELDWFFAAQETDSVGIKKRNR